MTDWEKREKLRFMTAISTDEALADNRDFEKLKDFAWIAFQKVRKLSPINEVDGSMVEFSRPGFAETSQMAVIDRRRLRLVPCLASLIEKSVPLWTEPPDEDDVQKRIRQWHYYGAKVNMDSQDSYVLILAVERHSGKKYYNNHVTLSSLIETDPAELTVAQREKLGASSPRGLGNKLYKWWWNVKRDEPPTGEVIVGLILGLFLGVNIGGRR